MIIYAIPSVNISPQPIVRIPLQNLQERFGLEIPKGRLQISIRATTMLSVECSSLAYVTSVQRLLYLSMVRAMFFLLLTPVGYKCTHCSSSIHKGCLEFGLIQTCEFHRSDVRWELWSTYFQGLTASPFYGITKKLQGLTFADVIVLEETYAVLKGMSLTNRSGTVITDIWTGVKMEDKT